MQTCLFNKTYLSLFIAVFLLFSFVLPVANISAVNASRVIRNIQMDSVISIQYEIDAASPGDTIFIPSGTYNENIVIDKSLNLVGEDKATTIIQGKDKGVVVLIKSDDVNISGFTITGSTSLLKYSVGCKIFSDDVTIFNCEIFSNLIGVYLLKNNVNILIKNCLISDNLMGVLARSYKKSLDNYIVDNDFVGNNFCGLMISILSDNYHIFHNNFIDNNIHASDFGVNYWDDGYPCGGNYWGSYGFDDKYHGVDQDIPGSDGMGDNVFSSHGVKDSYPFTGIDGWDLNMPPYPPFNPVPDNNAKNVDINTELQWNCGDINSEDILSYDVFFEQDDSSPDIRVSEKQINSFYTPGTLDYDSTYYWKIVAFDNHGHSSTSSVWNFKTESEPNDPPIVENIPDQTINEGDVFSDISLDTFVIDNQDDDTDISWSFNGNLDLEISIDTNRNVHINVPNADWFGVETVTFTATDKGGLSDSDGVVFTVNPVNDDPVAVDDYITVMEDTSQFIDVLVNDYDVDGDNLVIVDTSPASHGTVHNMGSSVEYVPNAEYVGSDSFDYVVSDGHGGTDTGTVYVTVTEFNDPPQVSNIPDQTQPEGTGFTSISLDNYVFDLEDPNSDISWSFSSNIDLIVSIDNDHIATITVPDDDWFGTETITFIATDTGGLSDSDDVVFKINNINDPPVANADNLIADEDIITFLDVLGNDIDVDGDSLTINYITLPSLGTAVNHGNRIEYIPNQNEYGTDNFEYTISDGHGGFDTASVVVFINQINDNPVISNIPDQTIDEGDSFNTISLDDYVTDIEDLDEDLTWTSSGDVDLTISISTNRILSINTPNSNWYGSETITFTVEDTQGGISSIQVEFNVNNVNDPPNIPSSPSPANNSIDIDIVKNLTWACSDIDGDELIFNIYFGISTTPDLDITGYASKKIEKSSLDYNKKYYWKIEAVDSSGATTSSPLWNFKTKTNGTQPQENQKPIADAGGPYNAYVNESIKLDAGKSNDVDGTIKGYRWDFNGDGNWDTDWSINKTCYYVYKTVGSYNLKLQVKDDDNATDMDSTTVKVTVSLPNKPPVSKPGGPYKGTSGIAVNLDGTKSSDSDGKIVSYNWDFGDGTKGSGGKVKHTYSSPGSFTVKLTVIDDDGAKDNATTIVKIEKMNNAPYKPTVMGKTEGDVGESFTFVVGSEDPDGDRIRFIFDWGDGSPTVTSDLMTETDYTECHSFNKAGVFAVKIKAQDEKSKASPYEELLVFVGVNELFVEDMIHGYLVDYDSNNVYDTFYNLKNGRETDMEVYGGRYWINTDADEDWEFVYNLEDKTVVEWSEKEKEYVTETSSSGGFLGGFGEFFASDAFKFIPIVLAAIIVVVLETGLVVLMKRKGFFKN